MQKKSTKTFIRTFNYLFSIQPNTIFLLLLLPELQSTFMTIIILSIVSATDIHVSPWINKKERIRRSIYKYLYQPRYGGKRGRSKENWNILSNNDKQKMRATAQVKLVWNHLPVRKHILYSIFNFQFYIYTYIYIVLSFILIA